VTLSAARHLTGMCPNFTGEWKLDRGASEFGFLSAPKLRIDRIVHDEPRLRIETRQKDTNGDITVVRDFMIGAEPVPVVIRGRIRLIRAFWDAVGLVVETTSEVSGNPRRIRDRWTLPDEDRITIERLHEQPGGAVHQRLQMQRLPTPPHTVEGLHSESPFPH